MKLSFSYVLVICDSSEMTIYGFLFSEPQYFFSLSSANSDNNTYLVEFNHILYAKHLVSVCHIVDL